MSDDNIVFPCPACGTKYSVSPHHAGKKTTCKKCGAAVTVPTPQVANPTIVGGTRTIRRADIDSTASTREEQVAAGPGTEVDMTGGASVLRKDETVIGAPAPAPATRGHTRRPAPGGARPAPAPGRSMPYGAPGGPAKKNNMPMILGIVGGVVGLILLIVIVIAATGGGSGDGGGQVADGNSGGSGGQKTDPDALLLAEMKKQYNNYDGLTLDQVKYYYLECGKRKDNGEFNAMRESWANALYRKADGSAGADELADIALMLDDDKHPNGRTLLEKACTAIKNSGKATREQTETRPDGTTKKTQVVNKKFKDIIERLGWKPYTRPPELAEAELLECEGFPDYNNAYLDIDQVYRDVGLYPPDLIAELSRLQEVPLEALRVLKEQDKDGFAIKSRKAWIRFKLAQDSKAKVDRVKGKRSFSPKAMGRDSEDFADVWTYTYGPSFMVYVEKPIGQDKLDPVFIETLESKKALLAHLYDWFRVNLIDKYNLQRQKPKDNAAIAQKEGWPMEIVVLKDRATFEKYCEDSMGQPMPGARAFYSPIDEQVMTYDDRSDSSPDTQWFNESVLIHETFHMLSDYFASNPKFTEADLQQSPRYTSILVQEGLTDSVSGFKREGDGANATYEFFELNHLRLQEFQAVYKILGNEPLYRIRDTIECRHYGQVRAKAQERWLDRKWKVHPMWINQISMSIYYASACQTSYFFQFYKEGGKYPYRDKWWDFVGMDYKGEIDLNSYDDNSGIAKFKEVFGIKSDKDWDDMEKKWLEYTMDLSPENVGKGAADLKEDEAKKDESVRPGLPPLPGYEKDHSRMPGLPGREEKRRAPVR
ncbi:MAG: hypothetical protein H6841_06875 [Planctomycetes bacterium]|nr:hypothetical protein [Planctomycetota bacterium]MCB9935305.1 hypothetical protein [Planctomycetota bacterium]